MEALEPLGLSKNNSGPFMKRLLDALQGLNCGTAANALFLLWVVSTTVLTAQTAASAQTFTTLDSFFSNPQGAEPYAGLVQATDGNLYGTTLEGGNVQDAGTVFRVTPSGRLTPLYHFCSQPRCTDGLGNFGGLIQATDGNLYGTTSWGMADSNSGTVFKITTSGTLTTLYSFCSSDMAPGCADGSFPGVALVQGTDGNFYGTTQSGGANSAGTVFKITPSGTLSTLYSFCPESGCTDGRSPYAGLVQATDGSFYGTTLYGGVTNSLCPDGCGTVFKIDAGGTLTTLHRFDGSDGSDLEATLIQGTDGNFYGTTVGGGAKGGYGTVFKIIPSGTLTTLYSFCSQSGCMDGAGPLAGLIQATDGNFYGTTGGFGANGYGTVFKITPSGVLTTLYSFCSRSGCRDGETPSAALMQDTSGNLFGRTQGGGTKGYGTVFRLSVGLKRFVETQPTSGNIGATVNILGTNLTGATSVSFNGMAAPFEAASSSEITTTVPTGATTGMIKVVTPTGTLSSNVPFRVP
jgi:uncharacterized repeat protein (TIGR03803 family)